jgi:salicylate hydroxylase
LDFAETSEFCRFVKSDTLEVAYRDRFDKVEEEYGDRFCAFHRVDLHTGLKELAEEEKGGEGWGPAAKIRLGAEVVGVDAEEGVLTIVDGSTVKKDLIILADGAHVGAFPRRCQNHTTNEAAM